MKKETKASMFDIPKFRKTSGGKYGMTCDWGEREVLATIEHRFRGFILIECIGPEFGEKKEPKETQRKRVRERTVDIATV